MTEVHDKSLKQLRAELIAGAVTGDAEEQAKRTAEFQLQVEKHFSRPVVEEMLRKLRKTPITAAWLKKQQEHWMFSTCIPGRILPWMLFGENWKTNPSYVPIARRLVVVNPR